MEAFNCADAFNHLLLQVGLVDLSLLWLSIRRTACSSRVCKEVQSKWCLPTSGCTI